MKDNLKPCPFCGFLPAVYEWKTQNEVHFYSIECTSKACKMKPETGLKKTRAQAMSAWNVRARRRENEAD